MPFREAWRARMLLAGANNAAVTQVEYLKCRKYPTRGDTGFASPFHVGEAGFLMLSIVQQLPVAAGVMSCPDNLPGNWVRY